MADLGVGSLALLSGPLLGPPHFPHLGCYAGAKTRTGRGGGSRSPPPTHPPPGVREWLVKGGDQLENKQVVRRLSDWSHVPYPGMVGEEEEKVGGREGGRGGVLSPVTCSGCA